MKTFINNDEYIIIFEEETIDDLTFINNKVKEIPAAIKSVIIDLKEVKYINSIFIDYLVKFRSILDKTGIILRLINCSENIAALIEKSHKDHNIEIKIKDI